MEPTQKAEEMLQAFVSIPYGKWNPYFTHSYPELTEVSIPYGKWNQRTV